MAKQGNVSHDSRFSLSQPRAERSRPVNQDYPEKGSEKGSSKEVPKVEPHPDKSDQGSVASKPKTKDLSDDSLKKYEDELNKRFTLPHEEPPKDKDHLLDFLLKRTKLLEVNFGH